MTGRKIVLLAILVVAAILLAIAVYAQYVSLTFRQTVENVAYPVIAEIGGRKFVNVTENISYEGWRETWRSDGKDLYIRVYVRANLTMKVLNAEELNSKLNSWRVYLAINGSLDNILLAVNKWKPVASVILEPGEYSFGVYTSATPRGDKPIRYRVELEYELAPPNIPET